MSKIKTILRLYISILLFGILCQHCGGTLTSDFMPGPGPEPETNITVTSVKLVRIDGTELDPEDRPIPVRLTIKVTFSQAPDQSKAEGAFQMLKGSGEVGGTISWDEDGTVMTFTPSADLDPSSNYSLKITATSYSLSAKATTIEEYSVSFETMLPGDIDGDGRPDVFISTTAETPPTTYLFRSSDISAGALNESNSTAQLINVMPASFAGDINFDGYDELFTYGPGPVSLNGAAYLFNGDVLSGNVITADALLNIQGTEAQSAFGGSAAVLGDVDGDNYPDVIFGAPNANIPDPPAPPIGHGATYFFSGGDLLANSTDLKNTDYQGSIINGFLSFLGIVITKGGDYNDDGASEVVIGSMGWIVVINGASLNQVIDLMALTAEEFEVIMTAAFFGGSGASPGLGMSIETSTDIDGDGIPDIFLGDFSYPFGLAVPEQMAGTIFFYSGVNVPGYHAISETPFDHDMNPASPDIEPDEDAKIYGDSALDAFGLPITIIGDIDSDGVPDVAVGASGAPAGMATGRVYIFSGADLSGTARAGDIALVKIDGVVVGGGFGKAIAGVGDINGDGVPDIAVSAPDVDPGTLTDSGIVYFFSGAALSENLTAADAFATITGTVDLGKLGTKIVSGVTP